VVHDRLVEAMDLRRLDLDALGSEELWSKVEGTIRQIVTKMDTSGEIDPGEADELAVGAGHRGHLVGGVELHPAR